MCLQSIYKKKRQKKEIKKATIGKEYIRLYKGVSHTENNFVTCLYGNYNNGLNIAVKERIYLAFSSNTYLTGFHCQKSKRRAAEWGKVIEVLVKPSWVTSIGYNDGITFICEKAVFPKYPKRKVTVKEFRKAAKGE